MSFVIKLKREFSGYYTGLYQLHGQSFVGCLYDIKNKKVKKYKKRKTAEKHVEEIKSSASFEIKYNIPNIICEIVEVEE